MKSVILILLTSMICCADFVPPVDTVHFCVSYKKDVPELFYKKNVNKEYPAWWDMEYYMDCDPREWSRITYSNTFDVDFPKEWGCAPKFPPPKTFECSNENKESVKKAFAPVIHFNEDYTYQCLAGSRDTISKHYGEQWPMSMDVKLTQALDTIRVKRKGCTYKRVRNNETAVNYVFFAILDGECPAGVKPKSPDSDEE